MDEVAPGQTTSTAAPASAGETLRAAREAHGLTIADIVARTRIPTRHLEAIEEGDYAGLPSSTYAVGFAKGYARAVGADEVAIAAQVREEVARLGRAAAYVPYETADPSRVPSRGVAIAGLGIALAVLILAVLWYGTTLFRGGGASEGAGAEQAQVADASVPGAAPVVAPAAPVAPTGGQVILAANDEVWLRVYDADDKTLFIGTMKAGDRFEVPATARDPMINVGRPDKLQVTLNGSAMPPLGTGERPIKDVRVSGAAVAARLADAGAAGGAAQTSQAVPARVALDPLAPSIQQGNGSAAD
ncbi:helix-turn-helix domain-containing protein [Sphingomonas sp.]|uniref:helix-turn-helix domain-containing protein n=1 Tax=Sphingomonas sp. TaxID=28214 RepID=UPI002D8092D5|nr:helix-turn-helix domain-containing protein [Sphingomonas sp.]HEU0043889.1 helix-turn-helix domain-containing protein [Sphingomonas sp.]